MPLPIFRLMICKAMDVDNKTKEYIRHQNKPDNGQWHRVSHPVSMLWQFMKLSGRFSTLIKTLLVCIFLLFILQSQLCIKYDILENPKTPP